MLSSAARFGDTTHLDLYGKNGYEVPDWSEGKDVPADIGRLAMAESEYVKHGFPEIDSLQISPDFATISRYDGTTTTNFGDDPKRAFASLLTGRRDPSLTGIGEATLLRALITHLSPDDPGRAGDDTIACDGWHGRGLLLWWLLLNRELQAIAGIKAGGISNPHFPALRADPLALSGASRRKQTPSRQDTHA
jgi:hypothetical protein